MLVIAFPVGFVRLAFAIGKGRNAGGLENLHHEGGAGAGQPGNDGDDFLCGNGGERLAVRLKHRHRSGLLGVGRNSVSGANLGGLFLSEFLESAASLQGLDLVEGLFGWILFMPACDLT